MTAANGAKRGCHSSLYEKIGELLDENKNLGREREYLDLLKKKQVRKNSSYTSCAPLTNASHPTLHTGLEYCKSTRRVCAVSSRCARTSDKAKGVCPCRSRAIGETTVRKEAPQGGMVSHKVHYVMVWTCSHALLPQNKQIHY